MKRNSHTLHMSYRGLEVDERGVPLSSEESERRTLVSLGKAALELRRAAQKAGKPAPELRSDMVRLALASALRAEMDAERRVRR